MKNGRAFWAFLAFFLAINLLLGGGLLLAKCLVSFGPAELRDAFQADYQNTEAFRSVMTTRFKELLRDAADGSAATHVYHDPNLLYVIKQDGRVAASNTSLALTGTGELPEGYSFRLYFDGEKVSLTKDGQDLDVYGDGYYREGAGSWYVPGYVNYTAPEEYGGITICMAAAREPLTYEVMTQVDYYSDLYLIVRHMDEVRLIVLLAVVLPLALGAALLVWYLLWRGHKAAADRGIARVTGRVWLECKLLLLIPLAFVLSTAVVATVNLVFYNASPLSMGLAIPMALWIAYLYVNDLRYNGTGVFHTSFCAACTRLFTRRELRYPVQRRMDRRVVWQFALCIPFFLFCALWVPYLYSSYFYYGLRPLLLLLLCLLGLALIASQLWLMGKNRKAAADLDLLLTRIQAAGEGRLDGAFPLPADSDLNRAAEQLSHMEAGLRTALDEQMKSERMKVELIANVSHDLKTPLTSIISYAELLGQEPDLPEHVQDYIRILGDKAQRLKSMVQEVFEVSKAASGNLSVRLEPLDLAKLLRQTLADMDEAIARSSLALRVSLPEEPVFIRADGDRLYRVFQNLLQNALQYSLDGSRVYLTLRVEGGAAAAAVQNTSRDELPPGVDFTERFVRGDESRTDGGSGLGLSIARTFTEACGGALRVEVSADLFTATVTFPLTDQRPAAEAEAL